MKEKQYDPAGNNDKSPAAGMAAVDTHNPGDIPVGEENKELNPEDDSRDKVNNTDNDRQ